MKLTLHAVGKLKKGPEQELCARYEKRIRQIGPQLGIADFLLREVTESRQQNAEARKAEEAEKLLQSDPAQSLLILLDETGASLDSRSFADVLQRAADDARPLLLAIGGPDGHSKSLLNKADKVLSFGAMTWPHQLARIMVMEQVYRAMTILAGHPYHRD